MNSKLEDSLIKAVKEKEKDDVINHPKKVRLLVKEYFDKNKVTNTLELKTKGYNISFIKGKDGSTEAISMRVNGKIYTGKEMDNKINEIDLIGPNFKNQRTSLDKKNKIKNRVQNVGRVAKIDLTRKIVNEPSHMAAEGNGILMQLLRMVGRTINKSVQSR